MEPTVDNRGNLTGFADGGDGGWGFSKLYSNVFISNAVITYDNVQLSGANAFLNKFVGVTFNNAANSLTPITANAFFYTNTAMGVINLSDGITTSYTRIYTSTGNAQIATVSHGNYANIEIGTVNSTETVFNYTDMVGGNNISNTAYLTLTLNSNAYGFPDYPYCNVSTGHLVDILNLQILEIGEIQNIIKTGPGEEYDTAPFVEIYQKGIASQKKQDHIIDIINVTKPYIVGEEVTQNVTTTSAQQLNLIAPSAAFAVNEYVYQINSTPTGTYVANTQSNLLTANTGNFSTCANGQTILIKTGGINSIKVINNVVNSTSLYLTTAPTGTPFSNVATSNDHATIAILKNTGIIVGLPTNTVINFVNTTTTFAKTLSGVAISNTTGGFTCTAADIAISDLVTITGTLGGTGTITDYTTGAIYKISAITGSAPSVTGFTLTTTDNVAIVTTAGTPTGLTYIAASSSTWIDTANVYGLTSGSTSAIANVHGSIYATAIGKVKVANSSQLSVRRWSLQDFSANGDSIIGKSSGATSNAFIVTIDTTSGYAGDNANVSANVVTANGTVSALSVITSGYGYVEGEILQFTSTSNSQHVGSVRSTVGAKGAGAGFYSSTRGFLSDDKYIQDGNYYQTFSYEINSSIDVSKYYDMVKAVVHTAGTALYGKVIKKSTIETALDISNSGNGPIQA